MGDQNYAETIFEKTISGVTGQSKSVIRVYITIMCILKSAILHKFLVPALAALF